MVLSQAAAVPSSSLACLGWFQESVTSEKSCCATGSDRARGSHPSILTSSRFMTHNKKQRLPAQHLACCENEDMDTALALILAWSQSITQFPEMAANRDTCWADLFWTSHASLARPPHRPLQGSEAQFQHGVDRGSVHPRGWNENSHMLQNLPHKFQHNRKSPTPASACQHFRGEDG